MCFNTLALNYIAQANGGRQRIVYWEKQSLGFVVHFFHCLSSVDSVLLCGFAMRPNNGKLLEHFWGFQHENSNQNTELDKQFMCFFLLVCTWNPLNNQTALFARHKQVNMKHCQSSDFAISNWIHFVFKSISNELVCVSDVPMLRKLHIIKFAQQFVWPKNTMSKQLHMNWSGHLVTLCEKLFTSTSNIRHQQSQYAPNISDDFQPFFVELFFHLLRTLPFAQSDLFRINFPIFFSIHITQERKGWFHF